MQQAILGGVSGRHLKGQGGFRDHAANQPCIIPEAKYAYQEALAPFFEKYICLLLSPECFDEPPAIPLIFNEATGCVYENGAWILESGEPQGCPLHVNPLQEAAES